MKYFKRILFFLVLFYCLILFIICISSAWPAPPESPLSPTSIDDCENFRSEYRHYLRMLNAQIFACLAVADLSKRETTNCCNQWWGANNPLRSSVAQCSSLQEEWCCASLEEIGLYNRCVAKVKGREKSEEQKNTATDLSDKKKIVDSLTRGLTAAGLPALGHPLARRLTRSNLAFLNKLSDENLKSLMQAFKDFDKDKSSINYLNQELNRIMTIQTIKESKESFYNSINEINEKLATKRKKDRERVETAAAPQSKGKGRESLTERQPVQNQVSCDDCGMLTKRIAVRTVPNDEMIKYWLTHCYNRTDCFSNPWYINWYKYAINNIQR